MPTPANLFAQIVFGVIGFALLTYGKKQMEWLPALTGIALLAYPWFVGTTWLLYAIGIALCAGWYVIRRFT